MEDSKHLQTAVIAGASALMASLATYYLTRSSAAKTTRQLPPNFTVDPSIQAALDANKPVVALESTVITHGMEYPQNKETAIALE